MVHVEIPPHFNLNRILLLAIGLWPYQRSILVRLQSIICFAILTSFVVFQFTTFVTTKYTPELAIKIISSTSIFIINILSYSLPLFKSESVKYLMEYIRYIRTDLRDKKEVAIIEKYGINAKQYTIGFISLGIFSMSGFIFLQIGPRILEIVVFLNNSRKNHMPIVTEYFLDEEKYYYLILLHVNAALCIGSTAMLATGLMIKTYFQYMCGMFEIASYRIKKAMAINMFENINIKTEKMIHQQIVYAVDIHCEAMKFSELFVSRFQEFFFLIIVTAVICSSLNFFRILQLLSTGCDIEEFMLHFGIVTVCFLYLFLGNHIGQEITDLNYHVITTAYNVRWYNAPLHIQRLILFLLQRGSKVFILSTNGLFVASLESFASMASASISYCTVLCSMQQY